MPGHVEGGGRQCKTPNSPLARLFSNCGIGFILSRHALASRVPSMIDRRLRIRKNRCCRAVILDYGMVLCQKPTWQEIDRIALVFGVRHVPFGPFMKRIVVPMTEEISLQRNTGSGLLMILVSASMTLRRSGCRTGYRNVEYGDNSDDRLGPASPR
jgi:hypothetical protein